VKHKKYHPHFLLIIGGVSILLLLLLTKTYQNIQPSAPVVEQNNNVYITQKEEPYTSGFLHLTVTVPAGFQILDKQITFTLSNQAGDINIIKNGTQFTNLKEYLKDFDSKSSITITNEKQIILNSYETISRMEESRGEYKVYYIFTHNSVYVLSTSSPSLYPILDQIAQSFRYNP
jgi:predicted Zn-dependent protease